MGRLLRAANKRQGTVRRLTLESLEGRQLFAADLNYFSLLSDSEPAPAFYQAVEHEEFESGLGVFPVLPAVPLGAEVMSGSAGAIAGALMPLTSIPALNSVV